MRETRCDSGSDHPPEHKKSDIIRFLGYLKPYWWLVVLAGIGGAVKLSMPLVFPKILAHFIDDVLPATSAMTYQEKLNDLAFWSLVMVALYVVIWIPFTYYRHYLAGLAAQKTIFDLRCQLYDHIQRMSASYYNRNRSGEIVSRMINDVKLVQDLIGNALTNIWMDSVVLIVVLVLMLKMNWILTLVSVSLFPLYIIFTKKLKKIVRQNSREVQSELAGMQGDLQEKITGYSVVKLFTRERQEASRFRHRSETLLEKQVLSTKYSTWNVVIVGLLTALMPVLVVYVGGRFVLAGALTIGEIVVFNTYLGQFYLPINRFSELNVVVAQSMAGVERIFHVLDTEPDVQDQPDAVKFDNAVPCRIELRDVSFKYEEGDEAVLKGISLTIDEGQKVALVGHSGCGKSTITNLITRFYDVNSGEVLIGGRDVKEYTLRSLRASIGMVFQETILFSGSIEENLRYAKPSATKEQMIQALRAANAYDFVMGMPHGMKTEVGEHGIGLSGGQKQRIAIARVFLKNPRILILDEATSALDTESETLIQDALDRLMNGRTSIVIAHRLSTIINSDLIVAMNAGEIVETGTHDELLARNGLYSAMYHKQFKDVIEHEENVSCKEPS